MLSHLRQLIHLTHPWPSSLPQLWSPGVATGEMLLEHHILPSPMQMAMGDLGS